MVIGPMTLALRSMFESKERYQIKISGNLSDSSLDHFIEMKITSVGEETNLLGSFANQAELLRMLNRIHSLGHTLLYVNRIEPDKAEKTKGE